MPSAVKCEVEECVYNDKLHCSAEAILVQTNGNAIVGTERGTLCATFSYQDLESKSN